MLFCALKKPRRIKVEKNKQWVVVAKKKNLPRLGLKTCEIQTEKNKKFRRKTLVLYGFHISTSKESADEKKNQFVQFEKNIFV